MGPMGTKRRITLRTLPSQIPPPIPQMAYQNKPDRHMSTNLLRHLAEFVGGRAVLRDRLQRLQADRGKRSNGTPTRPPPQRPSPVSSTPLRLAPLTSKYPKLYVGNLDSKLTHRPQAREFFHRREGRHLISSKKTTKNKTSSYYVLFSSQSLLTHSTHSIHSARPRTHP